AAFPLMSPAAIASASTGNAGVPGSPSNRTGAVTTLPTRSRRRASTMPIPSRERRYSALFRNSVLRRRCRCFEPGLSGPASSTPSVSPAPVPEAAMAAAGSAHPAPPAASGASASAPAPDSVSPFAAISARSTAWAPAACRNSTTFETSSTAATMLANSLVLNDPDPAVKLAATSCSTARTPERDSSISPVRSNGASAIPQFYSHTYSNRHRNAPMCRSSVTKRRPRPAANGSPWETHGVALPTSPIARTLHSDPAPDRSVEKCFAIPLTWLPPHAMMDRIRFRTSQEDALSEGNVTQSAATLQAVDTKILEDAGKVLAVHL